VKAYVMTSGAIFGLITLARVWRVFPEGPRLATEPWYVLITLAAAALCFWAWRVLRALETSLTWERLQSEDLD
jgi:hypothetical protein